VRTEKEARTLISLAHEFAKKFKLAASVVSKFALSGSLSNVVGFSPDKATPCGSHP